MEKDYTIKIENIEELIVGAKVPGENETIIEKNANKVISIRESKVFGRTTHFMDQYKLNGDVLTHDGGTAIPETEYFNYLNRIKN